MILSHASLTFPAHHDSARKLLQGLAAQTRTEPGCLLYLVSENLDVPGQFFITEHWDSMNDMQTHLALPGIAEAITAVQNMGVDDLSVTAWEAGAATRIM